MGSEDGGMCFQCPCCEACDECTEFRKIVDLKEAGLIIYLYTPHNVYNNVLGQDTAGIPDENSEDIYILQNTRDVEINSADFIPELEKNKIRCPRCLHILEHAQRLLQNVPAINKQNIIGICDHCKRINESPFSPSCKCAKIARNFAASTGQMKDLDDKERHKQRLTKKIQDLIKSKLMEDKELRIKAKRRSQYDFHIDKLKSQYSSVAAHLPDVKQLLPTESTEGHERRASQITEKAKTGFLNTIQGSVDHLKRIPRDEESLLKIKPTLKPKQPLTQSQKYQSEESLITTISRIEKDTQHKRFRYFFPKDVRKRVSAIRVSSSELIKDTQDRMQIEDTKKYEDEIQKKLEKEEMKRKMREEKKKIKEEKQQRREEEKEKRRQEEKQKRLDEKIKNSILVPTKKSSIIPKKSTISRLVVPVASKFKSKQSKTAQDGEILKKDKVKSSEKEKKEKLGSDTDNQKHKTSDEKQKDKDEKERLKKEKEAKSQEEKERLKKEKDDKLKEKDEKAKEKREQSKQETDDGEQKKEKGIPKEQTRTESDRLKGELDKKQSGGLKEAEDKSIKAEEQNKDKKEQLPKDRQSAIDGINLPKNGEKKDKSVEQQGGERNEREKVDKIDILKVVLDKQVQEKPEIGKEKPEKGKEKPEKEKQDKEKANKKDKGSDGSDSKKTKKSKLEPKSGSTPDFQEPKTEAKTKKSDASMLKLNEVKMKQSVGDTLIAQLVKMKENRQRPPRAVEPLPLTPVKKHVKKKQISIKSDVESSKSESVIISEKTKVAEVKEIIIGEKVYKYDKKRVITVENPQDAIVPVLFQTTFNAEPYKQTTVHLQENIPIKTTDQQENKGIIRYALSDRSFIDKGWTKLPTEKVVRKMNIYRMRPSHPEFDWFEHNKRKRVVFYDTGEKLAEFNDDGQCRFFYKNGKLALDYYKAEETNAQQRFVVYSNGNPDERGRPRPLTVLAAFDYLGNGVVYDHAGKTRLKYNQTEGAVLDPALGPVSNWKWHALNDPPVLQQVMIDTQVMHKDPEILRFGGSGDDATRPDNEDMLAIEFENFIKEKAKKSRQEYKSFQIRMKAVKINENFSLKVLDQATIYLHFREGTKNVKLNIGMLLDHKEIIDTDTADVGDVSNILDRFPARTDSIAGLQRDIACAQRSERARSEHERNVRPPQPLASIDRLVSGTSRPLRPPLRTDSAAEQNYLCKCDHSS